VAEFRLSNFTSGTALTAAELNTGLTYADYTPTWSQGVTITKTVNWARYTKFGKLIQVSIKMTASNSGTTGSKILVGLPVNASSNNFLMGYLSRSTVNPAFGSGSFAVYSSATEIEFGTPTGTNPPAGDYRLGNTPSSGAGVTIASNDVFLINLVYEAA
jgi:hypothetical protein